MRGYVLIEPIEEEEVTASGLVMPERAQDKPSKGKVLALGKEPRVEGTVIETWEVSVGDIVIHHKWATQEVKEGQKTLKLVQAKDIMGVYK